MARRDASFICQNCGAAYGRWQGKCDACGEWNTIAEESSATARPQTPGRAPRKGRLFALEPLAGAARDAPRLVIASPAAASCAARSCSLPAIPASANRRC
jgi:DNA repair protein RadA/Sms